MNDLPIILITGDTRGIGLMLVNHYSTKGYFVVGCGRSAPQQNISNYEHFQVDISKENEVKKMFVGIRHKYGKIDVVINNAGLSSQNFALLMTAEHLRTVLETNVLGTMYVTQEAVKIMQRKKYGRIVNISSIHVKLATKGTSVYGASKKYIEHFSRVLSKEMGQNGITINTVGLSFVKESGMLKEIKQNAIDKMSSDLFLDPLIDIEDVIYCIDFFISPKADFLSGQTLYAAGA